MSVFDEVIFDDIEEEMGPERLESLETIPPFFIRRPVHPPPSSNLLYCDELIDPTTGRVVGGIASTKPSDEHLLSRLCDQLGCGYLGNWSLPQGLKKKEGTN